MKMTTQDLIKLIKQRLNKTKSDYELNIKVSGEPFHNSSKKLVEPLIHSIKKVTTKTYIHIYIIPTHIGSYLPSANY